VRAAPMPGLQGALLARRTRINVWRQDDVRPLPARA
jgi:hypothetical protein